MLKYFGKAIDSSITIIIITIIIVQVLFWGCRVRHDISGVKQDLKWILSCLLLFHRHFLYLGILRTLLHMWTFAGLCVLGAILLLIFYRWPNQWIFARPFAGERKTAPDPLTTLKLKPLIFPCRTSHTRMFPKTHSFSYSYLYVGIPVGWRGSSGALLSVGSEAFLSDHEQPEHGPQTTKSWFHIEASDYLNRGDHGLGLKGKLHTYLNSQVGFYDH
jgi:hypothetical protein